jgi:hypothetical protein
MHTSLLIYDTLYVGDKPTNWKRVAYPQVPHTTQVMCDGKAVFDGTPKEGVCTRRKAHTTSVKRDRHTKVRTLTG